MSRVPAQRTLFHFSNIISLIKQSREIGGKLALMAEELGRVRVKLKKWERKFREVHGRKAEKVRNIMA